MLSDVLPLWAAPCVPEEVQSGVACVGPVAVPDVEGRGCGSDGDDDEDDSESDSEVAFSSMGSSSAADEQLWQYCAWLSGSGTSMVFPWTYKSPPFAF